MIEEIVLGQTLYSIARAHGVELSDLFVRPAEPGGTVWTGNAEVTLRAGDQVFIANGPGVLIRDPSDTLYSIARDAGLDQWQDLQVLRNGSLFPANAIPGGLQPGDRALIPHTANCCGEGEAAPTPTSQAQANAVEQGSAQDLDRDVAECDDKRVIVIDPGHGGTSRVGGSSPNNATAVSGVLEKDLALTFANVLKAELETPDSQAAAEARGYCDLEIVMTRTSDVNVGIAARRAVAAENGADIFVSLHFNGNGSPQPRGVETYIRTPGTDGQSNATADRTLASLVNTALFNAMQEIDPGARNRGVKNDLDGRDFGIGVLRDAGTGLSGNMSRSILIEIEFITNPVVDETYISGPNADDNVQHIMAAVARALIAGL